MTESTLDIFLDQDLVGQLILFTGDRSLYVFDQAYLENLNRPTLSQFFLNDADEIQADSRMTQTKLPPWFSNLLPEGPLRTYLGAKHQINPEGEFQLLTALGQDLPGAVRAVLSRGSLGDLSTSEEEDAQESISEALRFSLAGVQLKFSASIEKTGKLTLPASGIGGDWIVKLPSLNYPAVPENEALMLDLAQKAGICVPEHHLVPLEKIQGLFESWGPFLGKTALAVKRFDRLDGGKRVHMEDLAQVFGIFPHYKYEKVGFSQVLKMTALLMRHEAALDLVARLAFVVITGNGDMHLKNWSLIYPDRQHPIFSPAYDLVSTVPYIKGDQLALNIMGEKKFSRISLEHFEKLADKAQISKKETLQTVRQVFRSVQENWESARQASTLPPDIADAIAKHIHQMRYLGG